ELSEYQKYEIGHNASEDARKDRERADSQRNASIKVWQDRGEKHQTDQDKLSADNEKLGSEGKDLQAQLDSGAFKKGATKAKAQKRIDEIRGQIAGNPSKFNEIEGRKQQAFRSRDALMTGQPEPQEQPAQPAATAATPKAQFKVGQTVYGRDGKARIF